MGSTDMVTAENRINGIIRALARLRDAHPRNPRMLALMSPPAVELKSNSHDCCLFRFDVTAKNERNWQFDTHTVEFRVDPPESSQGRMSLQCQCPTRNGQGMCVHTYAVASDLARNLASPDNDIRQLLIYGEQSEELKFLNSIDALLELEEKEAQKEAQQQLTSVTPLSERLIWRVALSKGSRLSISVEPLVQGLKKNGVEWKKGTRVNYYQLKSSRLLQTTQDRAAAEYYADNQTTFTGSNYGPDPVVMLEHLAGNSRVFLADDQGDISLKISSGTLGLRCYPEHGELCVRPTCGTEGLFLNEALVWRFDSKLLSIKEAEGLLQVATAKSKLHVDFVTGLIKNLPRVPMSAASELLSRFSQLSTGMSVDIDPSLIDTEIDAHRTCYLELVPSAPQGLIVKMRAKPAITSATVVPGDRRVPSYVPSGNGKVSYLRRDVDAERQRGAGLVEELQLKQYSSLTDWDYRLTTDEQVIDFVIRLSERQHRRLAEQQQATQQALLTYDSSTSGVDSSNSSESSESSGSTALVPVAPKQELIIAPVTSEFGKIPDTDDLIVTWPQGGMVRVTREIESSALQLEVEEHSDWFGLNGQIVVDGHALPLSSILAALRAGRRVVPLGDGLYARISDEFYDRLVQIGDVVYQSSKGLEVDITAAPVLSQLVSVRESLQLCQSWRDMLSKLDPSATISTEPPISLNAELRTYQLEGYRWLKRLSNWGVGGCLADDMGLGKTLQALAIVLDRVEEGPTLVIAPMSVGFNWLREAQRFAPSLNIVSYRDHRETILNDAGEGDVVVVSYPLFQRDAEKFWEVKWGTLILDEAQNVKNATTKTARAVRDLDAKWRLALTGTPIENQLSELWALFRSVTPGLFGSWERFREKFVTPIEKNGDTRRRFSLAQMVKPFILRRTKNEVLKELPDRTEVLTTIELSDEERKLYEAARVRIVADLMGLDFGSGKDHRIQVLAGITKLRQLACHPALCDKKWKKSSSKLDSLLELVDELRQENHRALIFSQFTQHLGLVRSALEKAGVTFQYLDGSSTAKQRAAAVDAFQAGEGDVFLISLKAGGTGLNLTAADYVIHLDPWWNPAVEDQATDRAHRIGQTRPVTVYRLVTKDTIEEKILSLHERKRQLVSSVLDGSDEAAKLSTEELIDLIKTAGAPSANPEFELSNK